MKYLVVLALMLTACLGPVQDDVCAEWTWIDEEACLMDTCAELQPQQEIDSECRSGQCWCCWSNACMNSKRIFPAIQ